MFCLTRGFFMAKFNKEAAKAADLRRRAEELLRAKTAEDLPIPTEADSQRLLHELEVHRIELEMQNAELRQARDEAEKALDKYTDLYDFAPVAYFTFDRNGVIRAVNLTGAALLGVERARLIGRRFGQFVAIEARTAFAAFLGKVLASPAKEACEVELMKGGEQPLFVQIEAVAAAGQECRAAVIDITGRKRAEAEIQRLASFPLENPNPILEMDIDGRVTFCNPAAKQALKQAGCNNGVNPFIPPDMPAILQKLKETKTHQCIREVEIDGNFFNEVIFMPQQFQSVRFYTMNITERRQLEMKLEILHSELAARAAELESTNREMEAFNYTVAHDLRRPLTNINGYCQIMREVCGDKLDETCRGYLQEAYDSTLRMNQLIDALLNFSRLAHVKPRRETVDLSSLAKEVAAELSLTGPGRSVTFRISDGVGAEGDAALLRVVLDNLLGNAWKYTCTRDEGIIEFGTKEVDGKPAWFVRDNGTGFDKACVDKLFVPFQRLPGAEECRGFGIGLATVERIIRRHGGRVWAEGEPDKGATFYFTLSAEDTATGA
jgi:PAS domain S-box-containing protein